jgi:hypothetical protein
MSEQFIKAYTISLAELYAIVGKGDPDFVARALEHDVADEVGELLGETGLELEEVLSQLTAGKIAADNAYGYRRVLELVAGTVGTALEDEATMPGRGWHELGPAWKSWDQPALASIWGGESSGNANYPWPWKENDDDHDCGWPVAIAVPNKALQALGTELAGFVEKTVIERGVPKSIDRFSDPEYWPLEDLAGEIANIVAMLIEWIAAARESNTDLLLWLDGQQ